jgi:hypothetical protein
MDARDYSIKDPDRMKQIKVDGKEVKVSRIEKTRRNGYLKISNFKQDGVVEAKQ